MRIFKTKSYHIVAIADGKYLTAGEDNLITAEQPKMRARHSCGSCWMPEMIAIGF